MPEPLRATFFALQKRDGGILLGATVCYVILFAILMAAFTIPMFAMMGLDFGDAFRGAPPRPAEPPDPMTVLLFVSLGFVLVFALCVLAASFEAACLRWMIRGEKPGLFGLTLDADTWRVYGVYWIWLLFTGISWIGFLILSGLLGVIFPSNQIAWWIGVGLYASAIGVSAVSLAPAAAVSVVERRIAFGDAFNATENRFPSLLGSFIVLTGAQYLMTNGLTAAWVFWALNGDVIRRFAGVGDWASFGIAYNQTISAAMSEPGALQVYWVISAVGYVVSFAISVLIYGVNARVARLALEEGSIRAAPRAA